MNKFSGNIRSAARLGAAQGFTLLEVMATVAIAGVLMAIALTNYRAMVLNNCLTTGANTLVSSMQFARSEAVTRKTDITLTAANPADSQNEWGSGWEIATASDVLRVVSLTCESTRINETGDRSVLTYDSQGFVDAPGTFDICDERSGVTGRQVTVSPTGRPSTDSSYNGCT